MASCTAKAGKAYMGNVREMNMVDKRVDSNPRDVLAPVDISSQNLLLRTGRSRLLTVAGFTDLYSGNTCLVAGPSGAMATETSSLSSVFLGVHILKDEMASATIRYILKRFVTVKTETFQYFCWSLVFTQFLEVPLDMLRFVSTIKEVLSMFFVTELERLFASDVCFRLDEAPGQYRAAKE